MIHISGTNDNMIANNLTPFIPTCPGEVIKDELEARGITQRQLADVTGISYSVVNEVLNGKRPVTIEYALLIGKALDIEPSFFVNMQSDYDLQMARRNKTLTARLNNIRKIAAVL